MNELFKKKENNGQVCFGNFFGSHCSYTLQELQILGVTYLLTFGKPLT